MEGENNVKVWSLPTNTHCGNGADIASHVQCEHCQIIKNIGVKIRLARNPIHKVFINGTRILITWGSIMLDLFYKCI